MGYLKDFLAREWDFTKFIKNSNAVGVARAGREIEVFIHGSDLSRISKLCTSLSIETIPKMILRY